jgi:putative spermidine/putrescine transport system ATP-binding protein
LANFAEFEKYFVFSRSSDESQGGAPLSPAAAVLNPPHPAFIVGHSLLSSTTESGLHLEIRRLSKSYGFTWALKDIDLELRGGDSVALLGPTGAGKTTLLTALAGLLRPASGEVHVDGADLRRWSARLRPTIGLLSPSDHLYEKLTAEENLRLFLALYSRKEKNGDIGTALASAGLADWSGEYVAALSSGMKCRLSIAKWLLLEPKVLLVDEPYGVLDGGGVDFMETQLKNICARGGIVVMATHDVTRAGALCSRAVVLRRGKLIFDEARRTPWESFYRAVSEFRPHGEAWPS